MLTHVLSFKKLTSNPKFFTKEQKTLNNQNNPAKRKKKPRIS